VLTSGSLQFRAPVAQRIEHLPSKQRAAGSSPAGGTISLLLTPEERLVVALSSRSAVPLIRGTAGVQVVIVQGSIEQEKETALSLMTPHRIVSEQYDVALADGDVDDRRLICQL
jgi:hypothetical protein